MPSQWDDITGFGAQGVQSDVLPFRRDKASLDLGENCRPQGGDIVGAGSYTVTDTLPASFSTIFYGREGASPDNINARRLVLTGLDSIYTTDGFIWHDITNGPVSDTLNLRWSGGWMQACFVLANRKVTRSYIPGVNNATVPMVWDGGPEGNGDTWEDIGNTTGLLRPAGPSGEYCFAADIWEADPVGRRYPSRIRWAHPVASGEPPSDWVVRDTNQAGYVDIDDQPDPIREIVPLRDYSVIYKVNSIWIADYIGGTQIFRFRPVIRNKGVNSENSVVEHNGIHYCLSGNDIFVFDGSTAKSIIWGKVKEQYLSEVDENKSKRAFVAVDAVREEVLFFYIKRNTADIWPNRVLVYDLNTGTFWFRDYSKAIPHALGTPKVSDQESSDHYFNAISVSDDKLLNLEDGTLQNGAPLVATVSRNGLYSGYGHDWVQVDAVSLGFSGGLGTFRLGGQVAPDAPIVWRPTFTIDPTTDYKNDVRHNDNLISYELKITGQTSWQLSNISLLVQQAGKRG